MSLNNCEFIGNLGKDPEMQYTPGGTAMTKFSIGVSDRVKVGDKWQKQTEWVELTAFGSTAEFIKNYAKKGSLVKVVAKYTRTKREDKNGKSVTFHNFTVKELDLLSGGRSKNEVSETPVSEGDNNGSYASDGDFPF